MSQDGSWQDLDADAAERLERLGVPEAHPGGEAFIPRPSVTERTKEWARLVGELREARLTLAAIVTQHGEALGDGRYRLAVAPEHLETAKARRLTVVTEPNSGAMLLRVRPL